MWVVEETWKLPTGIMRYWKDVQGHAEDFEYTALRNQFRYEHMREPTDEESAELRVIVATRVQLLQFGKPINQMDVIYEEVTGE